MTIDIQFDFTTLGAGSFYTPARRAALNEAARAFETRINNDLAAIPVSSGQFNTWQPSIPLANGGSRNLPARSIPANTLVILAGTGNFGGSTAGLGGTGIFVSGFEVSSDFAITDNGQDWLELLLHRGNEVTEYSTWGGALYLDSSDRDWYDGLDPTGAADDQTDMVAIAQHEIAHILGYTDINVYSAIADANPTLNLRGLQNRTYGWSRFTSGNVFTGPQSRTAWDGSGNVPIDDDHWTEVVTSDGVETALDPSGDSVLGRRKFLTTLDWAGLDDIGWDIDYPPALTFTLNGTANASTSVDETDSDFTIPGVVTRSTLDSDSSGNLVVSLASTDTSVLTVPATVTIPNGQNSAQFNVTVKADADFDDELATITINSTVATNAPQAIEVAVSDDEVPELVWTISPTTVRELSNDSIANVRISRTGPTVDTPTTVTLTSPDTTELTFDGAATLTVTIPANGTQSEPFAITVEDDEVFDGQQSVDLRASAGGFANSIQTVIVQDNELPTLTVNAPASLTEGVVDFVDVVVTRNTTVGSPNVTLTANPAAEVQIETATLQIPAGENQVVFRVRANDDSVFDGTVNVTLTANAGAHNSGSDSLTTIDNERPALSLTVTPATFSEVAGDDVATATVSRTGPTDTPLTVNIAVSGPFTDSPAKVTAPASITIPADSASATFSLSAVDNSIFDVVENRVVTITASSAAAGTPGSATVTVAENETASPIDFDQDGEFLSLQDGILAIRHLADFSGEALVNNAVDPGGDRTSASEITAALSQLDTLDVDGNGESFALTDGILLIRYYAGFAGDVLIDGAIGSGATRTTAQEIIDFLDAARNDFSSSGPVARSPIAPLVWSFPADSESTTDQQRGRIESNQAAVAIREFVPVPQTSTSNDAAASKSQPNFGLQTPAEFTPIDFDRFFEVPNALADALDQQS